jgi:hypothetical protein
MSETTEPREGQYPPSFALPTPDPGRYRDCDAGRCSRCQPVPTILSAAFDVVGVDPGLEQGPAPAHPSLPQVGPDWEQLFLMAVTGDAFGFTWFPRQGERPMLGGIPCLPDPGTPYRRALGAVGLTSEVLVRPGLEGGSEETWPSDAAALKQLVLGSLTDRRFPVIAAGLPEPDQIMLVTSCESGGDVLTGWRAVGGGDLVNFEPAGQVHVRDLGLALWKGSIDLVVLITGRQERPPLRVAVREALEQAVTLLRSREVGPYEAGPAGWEAWARALLSDDPPQIGGFSTKPQSVNTRRRWLVLPITWDLMERRTCASMFLLRAIELFPAVAAELQAAFDCLDEVSGGPGALTKAGELMGVWGGDPGPDLPQSRDPELRRQMADFVRQCAVKELEVADHLERALRQMK